MRHPAAGGRARAASPVAPLGPWMMLKTVRMLSPCDFLRRTPDPRRQRGKHHPLAGAAANRVGRPRNGRYHALGMSTLYDALKGIEAETLEELLAESARTEAPRPTSRWPLTA